MGDDGSAFATANEMLAYNVSQYRGMKSTSAANTVIMYFDPMRSTTDSNDIAAGHDQVTLTVNAGTATEVMKNLHELIVSEDNNLLIIADDNTGTYCDTDITAVALFQTAEA